MLSIEQTKKLLGDEAEDLTEEQITEIRDGYRFLAEVIFGKWKYERDEAKKKKLAELEKATKPQTPPSAN